MRVGLSRHTVRAQMETERDLAWSVLQSMEIDPMPFPPPTSPGWTSINSASPQDGGIL
jgi:hypothetical protein